MIDETREFREEELRLLASTVQELALRNMKLEKDARLGQDENSKMGLNSRITNLRGSVYKVTK